jgi:molybdate transport system permease protein
MVDEAVLARTTGASRRATRPRSGRLRTPLPWLSVLLVLYLVVPIVAFVFRIPGVKPADMTAPGVWDALLVSVITACISTGVVTVLGVPLGYLLAHAAGSVCWSARSCSCRWRCHR